MPPKYSQGQVSGNVSGVVYEDVMFLKTLTMFDIHVSKVLLVVTCSRLISGHLES